MNSIYYKKYLKYKNKYLNVCNNKYGGANPQEAAEEAPQVIPPQVTPPPPGWVQTNPNESARGPIARRGTSTMW
jgi:hypothetical protein